MRRSGYRDETLARIGAKLDQFQRTGVARFEIDAAGSCMNPQGFEHEARAEVTTLAEPAVVVAGHGRCRRCTPCLKARAALWTQRALLELAYADRSWFGTFTLSAENQLRYLNLARRHVAKWKTLSGAPDFDQLEESERFAIRCRLIGVEITKWLKRVRFNSGAVLRYLVVAEAHVSGDPHFHLLVHERTGTVKKRQLQGSWQLGFSQFKLVEDGRAAFYACKYLNKSSLARVRASLRYGQEPPQGVATKEREGDDPQEKSFSVSAQ